MLATTGLEDKKRRRPSVPGGGSTVSRAGADALASAKHQPPRNDQRFGQDTAGHFALTEPSLDEDNRNLADAASPPGRLVQHLHNERVAVRDHRVERQPLQRLA